MLPKFLVKRRPEGGAVVAGRSDSEQAAFEEKIDKKVQERIKAQLKEIQKKNKKNNKITRKCNCGRIK